MNTRSKAWFCVLLSLLLAQTTHVMAQNSNQLCAGSVNGMRGKVISVPIYLDNTSEIAALQFDITLPSGSQVQYDSTTVAANRRADHGPKDPVMLEREARVLEMLIAEGLFGEER